MTTSNLFTVADKVEQGMSLFRAGFKAEVYWGDEIDAHHMRTRSVYTFKQNDKVTIVHDAPYHDNGHSDVSTDRFTVRKRTVLSYHERGTEAHSITETVGTFDNWLSAYYCAQQVINNLNQ